MPICILYLVAQFIDQVSTSGKYTCVFIFFTILCIVTKFFLRTRSISYKIRNVKSKTTVM